MSNPIDKRGFKDSAYGQLARIGKALSSPKRLELLDLLCQTDRTVEILSRETEMSIANTSQHLQVLEAARLVRAKKQGRFVVYSLADALVGDFFRAFRVLAEDRLAEIEQLRRRFLEAGADLDPVDAEALTARPCFFLLSRKQYLRRGDGVRNGRFDLFQRVGSRDAPLSPCRG